jgi:DNA-binding CsgD family transcriptional regulator
MGLEEGRQAFARQEWREAYAQLLAADAAEPLEPLDLERLAQAAYLVGLDAEAASLFRRAHQAMIDAGRPDRAARWGFWLSFDALQKGDRAQSAGWLAYVQRLVKSSESVEQAYVHMLSGLQRMIQGDGAGAIASFESMVIIAERFADADLLAFGLVALGQAQILLGRIADGVASLDEAMVPVAARRVSPMTTGIVYCAVILTCQRIFDLRRCREWTRALGEWCNGQPDLVPYRGECMVLRSEILQLEGEWSDAIAEACLAIELDGERSGKPAGRAAYRCAELHRLRGDFERAEELYREAGRRGIEPQPGLSLLRLAQRQQDAATAAIRRVVSEAKGGHGPGAGTGRAPMLTAYVEIMLAVGDLAAARSGAEELGQIAESNDAPVLRATWRQAAGAVELAAGEATAALVHLRDAWTGWQDLEAPYEAARVRVLIGRACRALGDEDTARSHMDAAARVFERLGAAPALAELDTSSVPAVAAAAAPAGHSLSAREIEVLRLVAAGKSNREVGAALFISEHTVARHLSNIFTKLDVTSRTAAAALARERRLV